MPRSSEPSAASAAVLAALVVLRATEDELLQHDLVLDSIARETKHAPVFRRPVHAAAAPMA